MAAHRPPDTEPITNETNTIMSNETETTDAGGPLAAAGSAAQSTTVGGREVIIPPGLRRATVWDVDHGLATHALCAHGTVVHIHADSHGCNWAKLTRC